MMDYREAITGGTAPGELNCAYGLLEEKYNGLGSNWEWFVTAGNAPDNAGCRMAAMIRRVEQN